MTPCNSGAFLTAAAAIVAIQVAQGRSEDEIAVLGAFFSALGDNLELMAAAQPQCSANTVSGQLAGDIENTAAPFD